MKKILFSAFIACSAFLQVNAQACTIDPSVIPSGKYSYPDTLPCVVRGVAYSQIVQFKIPASINAQDFGSPIPITFYVDSMVITGATGLPSNITATYNPSSGVFYGGSAGCFKVAGTTNDPAGNYPVNILGTITVHSTPIPGFFDGDTTIDLSSLSGLGANPFGALALDVINAGDQCRPVVNGIQNVGSFNAIIKVYPTPAHNTIHLDINTVDRINGTIQVTDMLGNKVYEEKIDLIGLMNKQINVSAFATGMYTLQISDTKNAYKTKFVVE
jgi:hypothetical protein